MADELELDVVEPKKSNLILILAVMGISLILGGGAAWFFLGGTSGGANQAVEKVDTSQLPLHYLTLTPEFIVNFAPTAQVRYLQIDVQLATREEESLKIVETYNPVIRNDILVLLSGLSFEELSQPEGKVKLQQQILNTVNKVVSEAGHTKKKSKKKKKKKSSKSSSPSSHGEEKGAEHDEIVEGPIENIYFTSFIMQ